MLFEKQIKASGKEWNIFTGQAIGGDLTGTQLDQFPITYAFWFGWADYHQSGEVYLGID